MDKIYSAQDVSNIIAKVEELAIINDELEELLYRGSNDERLVEVKRELWGDIKNFRGIVSDINKTVPEVSEIDAELLSLKEDFDSLVARYKKRRIDLQTAIRRYTNGNTD